MTGVPMIEPRLEMVRLMREHSYGVIRGVYSARDETVQAADWALEQSVETMAAWVDMTETVMANLRQVYARYQESLVD